jgi:hypothetical protein
MRSWGQQEGAEDSMFMHWRNGSIHAPCSLSWSTTTDSGTVMPMLWLEALREGLPKTPDVTSNTSLLQVVQ